jgi:recombination protein RecA
LGVEYDLVDKRGAYFRYGETLLGQGRENAKTFLMENPEMTFEIENLIRQAAGLGTIQYEDFEAELVPA